MDLELPPWLDSTFLAAALQGGEEEEPRVTVRKFSATPAVAAGDNYMSRLYRVRVEYVEREEDKSTSLIVKAPFTKGMVVEMAQTFDFYGKEPNVYKKLLPIINELIGVEFGPVAFYNPVNNVMVLTDLSEQGYEMGDRFKQLDFPHCEQVLKTLAKFHAGSVACKRDHPELIDLVGKEIFYLENERFDTEMKPWIAGSIKYVAGVVAEMELSKEAEELFLSRAEVAAETGIRLCQPKTTGLNVLNHGDLWVNNILFKHTTSGHIEDVRFIDFQMCRYTTPVLDLIYFFWSSANEEVRESRLPELCEMYRNTLNSTLGQLGCEERLTPEELHEDLKNAVDWAIVTICNLLPIISCDTADVINVEEIERSEFQKDEKDEKFLKLYNGKYFRALLPKVVTHFLAWAKGFNK